MTIDGSRANNLNIASLSVEHQLEEEKLNALIETLNLEIRTAFQQWLKAGDSLEQAQRNLDRAKENQEIVKTKKQSARLQDMKYSKQLLWSNVPNGSWNQFLSMWKKQEWLLQMQLLI